MPRGKAASRRRLDTPTELLRAAERLFAKRGIDSVSLREIAAEAGQANHSAALYHFSTKHGLIDSLITRHSDAIQAEWLVRVQEMTASGRDTLEEIVSMMVRSLVAKLDDPDGGTNYLMIAAQLVTSRSFPITAMGATMAPGVEAMCAALTRHIAELAPRLVQLRMMRIADVLYCSIANYVTVVEAGAEVDRELFVDDLIRSIVCVVRS